MAGTANDVLAALKAQGKEVMMGKGGFFIKGEGFLSLSKARRLTKIRAPKRPLKEVRSAWGDWAIVEMMNRSRKVTS